MLWEILEEYINLLILGLLGTNLLLGQVPIFIVFLK